MEPATAFQPEHPIERPEEDELGRFPFAEQFAAAVRDHLGNESLVIALNGAWGSGKSSIWKMAQFALEKDQQRKTPEIVYFPLWEISGAEPLAAEFFSKLSEAVDRALVNAGEPPLRGLVLRYGERVAGGLQTVGKLSEAAGELGVSWLSFAGKVTGVVSGWFTASKEKLKARIAESLRRLPQPVIVVFDDIDRLTADEVALLFRLVKANADFPRFVYVLLFDREYAKAALDEVAGQRGDEFIEKVVQVTIDVPAPHPGQLRSILDAELRRLANELKTEITGWLEERVDFLLEQVLLPAVRHLRDVRRYVNSLRFHTRTLTQHGAFQANFVDLAALEAARIWMPAFHDGVRRRRSELVRQSRGYSYPERGAGTGERFEELVQLAGTQFRTSAERILHLVFGVAKGGLSHNGRDEFLAHRRAAHDDFFDLYFQFELSADSLGQHEINALLASAESPEGFAASLRRFLAAGRLPTVFDYLRAHKTTSPEERRNIVQALVDVSDEILSSDHPEMRRWARGSGINDVALAQVKTERDIVARTDLVLSVVRAARALAGVVEIGYNDLYKREPNNRDHFVADDRTDELRLAILPHLVACQETTLPTLGRYITTYLRLWADWGGGTEVAEWIRRRLATRESFLRLVEVFWASYSDGYQEKLYFEAASIAQLIPWSEVLAARNKHFGTAPATSAEPLLERFDEGVKRDREKLDALKASPAAAPKTRRKKRN